MFQQKKTERYVCRYVSKTNFEISVQNMYLSMSKLILNFEFRI